jgi:hypothetical protein
MRSTRALLRSWVGSRRFCNEGSRTGIGPTLEDFIDTPGYESRSGPVDCGIVHGGAMFHYTDKQGYDGIRSQPTWKFIAHQPPGEHPKGAYFTDLDKSTPPPAIMMS